MKLKEIKVKIREDKSFENLFDNLLKEYFKEPTYPYRQNIFGFGILHFKNRLEMLGRIKMLADIIGISSVSLGISEEEQQSIKMEDL